ncbi:MAG: sulfide/dihydroorotate dehydrogenase-like FAD/NAD-binding protein [Dehalococcoidia bacterium]|nr:sulfide/dihydroorotate dehydrogenase-like FAD/NAD-binding protein [Dehalococcoidia bacterium]
MNNIVVNKELAPKIKLFDIYAPEVAAKAKPGNFVILRIDEKGERFPLTIAGIDSSSGTLRLVFNEVGKSTKKLGNLLEGDEVLDLVGPLGNASEIDDFGNVLCVGGGVLVAPLHFIASALHRTGNKVITIIGARNKNLLIFEDELKSVSDELYVTTDDGSKGYSGLDFVKEILDQKNINRAVAMGPVAMLKAVCEITKPYNIKTMVALTPIMLDGTGMCGGCRVSVDGQTKFSCVDGPEFDGHQVDWELLSSRMRTYSTEERISSLFYEVLGEERLRIGSD